MSYTIKLIISTYLNIFRSSLFHAALTGHRGLWQKYAGSPGMEKEKVNLGQHLLQFNVVVSDDVLFWSIIILLYKPLLGVLTSDKI